MPAIKTPKKHINHQWKVALQDKSGHQMIAFGDTYEDVWERVAYSENFDIDESVCRIYRKIYADVEGQPAKGLSKIDYIKKIRTKHYPNHKLIPKGAKVIRETDRYLVVEYNFAPRWVLYEVMYGDEDFALINQMVRGNFDEGDI